MQNGQSFVVCCIHRVKTHVVSAGQTVPMQVGQDGPHASGAKRSPCKWGKTVSMQVGQDGPYVLSHVHMVTLNQIYYT